MRPRLAFALLVSIILIIVAGVFRFIPKTNPASLDLIATNNNIDIYNSTSTTNVDSLNAQEATSSVDSSSTPLSQTDLIGQQLFSDYLNLNSNGAATPENITALAGTYADNIIGLKSAPTILATDLKITSNSSDNLRAYWSNFLNIYNKYQDLMNAESNSGKNLNAVGPDLNAYANNMSNLYGREADEFKSLPVPQIIALNHLNLINTYLSSSWAMKSLSNMDTDPAGAFAGIVAEKGNLQDEQTLIGNIQKILEDNGIILKTQ